MGNGPSASRKNHLKLLKKAKCKSTNHLMLFWVRDHSSLYHRLSDNIVREVTAYIHTHDSPLILATADTQVYLFSLISKKIFPFFKVTLRNARSIQKCVFMGEDKVLMALESTRDTLFAMYTEGQIQSLGERANKVGCEMIYDHFKDCVYLFGGQGTKSFSTKATESFTDSPPIFRPMADMQQGRIKFACCWHSQVVYLCGGGPYAAETFDPRSETFALFPGMEGIANIQFAASLGRKLMLLTPDTIWVLRDGRWESTIRKDQSNARSGTATVWDGVVYYQYSSWDGEGIIGYDLSQGKPKAYFVRTFDTDASF